MFLLVVSIIKFLFRRQSQGIHRIVRHSTSDNSLILQQIKQAPLVVILFLTHTSMISQPELWVRWKMETIGQHDSKNVLFVIHSPEEPKQNGEEGYRQFVWLGNRNLKNPIHMGKTSWCSPSIVYETLRAYNTILQEWFPSSSIEVEKRGCIALVSGFDIPIKAVSTFFEMKDSSYYYNQDHIRVIERPNEPYPNCHPQWMILSVKTIRQKVCYWLGDNETHWKNMIQEFVSNMVRFAKTKSLCLDNRWFFIYQADKEKDRRKNEGTTFSYDMNNSSPFEWRYNVLHTKYKESLWRSILHVAQTQPTVCFYRKVHSEFPITDSIINSFFLPLWNGQISTLSPLPQVINDQEGKEGKWQKTRKTTISNNFTTLFENMEKIEKYWQSEKTLQSKNNWIELFQTCNYDVEEYCRRLDNFT